MPKIGFLMPTAKNRFQILNLHPKKHVFKKKVLKEKITIYFAGDGTWDIESAYWYRNVITGRSMFR